MLTRTRWMPARRRLIDELARDEQMQRYGTPFLRRRIPPPITGHGWPDRALLGFLRERLLEEVPGATARRDRALGEERAHAARALRVLTQTAEHLRTAEVDPRTVRVLVLAYRAHPLFRPEWDPDLVAEGGRETDRRGSVYD